LNEFAAALEATQLAQFLKVSRWVYPLVNAGHILGVALLVGAIVPMDLRLLRGDTRAIWLRRYAAFGFALALTCGAMLFVTQATDYVGNGWFQAKMALLAVALLNVAAHPRLAMLSFARRRLTASISLALWPAVLIGGRLIGYS
jgi:uncharacterized membrane protein